MSPRLASFEPVTCGGSTVNTVLLAALAAGSVACPFDPPTRPDGGGRPERQAPTSALDDTYYNRAWSQVVYERDGEPHEECVPTEPTAEHSPGVERLWDVPIVGRYYYQGLKSSGAYLFMGDHMLNKLDAETGELLRSTRVGLEYGMLVGPDGLLYVYGWGVGVTDPNTDLVVREIDYADSGEITNQLLVLPDGRVVVHSFRGYLKMFYPTSDGGSFEPGWEQVRGGSAWDDGIAYDALHDLIIVGAGVSLAGSRATLGIQAASGEIVWEADGYGWDVHLFGNGLFVRQVRADRWVEGVREPHTRVELRDRETGALRHAYEYGIEGPLGTNESGGRVYVVERAGEEVDRGSGKRGFRISSRLVALDPTLTPVWEWETPDPWAWTPQWFEHWPEHLDSTVHVPPLVQEDGSVFVQSSNCHVYHFDRAGQMLWWARQPYRIAEMTMARDGDVLYAATSKKFEYKSPALYPAGVSKVRAYRTRPRQSAPARDDP